MRQQLDEAVVIEARQDRVGRPNEGGYAPQKFA
jgi:hypothetical protein